MTALVAPAIRRGGVNTVYATHTHGKVLPLFIMIAFTKTFYQPNLVPPVTTVQHALEYRSRLEALEPRVKYLMSIFLHESTTPETIIEAKKSGNYRREELSSWRDQFVFLRSCRLYPVLSCIRRERDVQRQGLILNLHGECPSKGDITVMSAEERFLPTLLELHERFPNLRIVLENI